MISGSAQTLPNETAAKARYNMVEGQIRPNRVTHEGLLAALSAVPREIFVPPALAGVAYVDQALRIAPGRYLLEPLFLARLLQEASVAPTDKVLVIGGGTGYSAAILARIAGSVTLVESDEALAALARANLDRLGAAVTVHVGDLASGSPAGEAYDVILIDGAVIDPSDSLVRQLAPGGRLVTIRSQEGRSGAGMLYRKVGERLSGRALFDAVGPYLPGFEPKAVFTL